MAIQCKNCETKFKIADDKLPVGKGVTLKCPKCESKIEVGTADDSQPATPPATLQAIIDEMASDTYDAALRPFEFLEAGIEAALICEQDKGARAKIRASLKRMNYNIIEASSTRDALKYMRSHTVDLVVLNESFDGGGPVPNYVLKYLEQLPMATRRNVFVVLLGNGFRTGDYMIAFNKSVNLVVNQDSLDNIEV